MKKRIFIAIVSTLTVSAVCLYAAYDYMKCNDAITRLDQRSMLSSDGREARVFIGGNPHDQEKAVIVVHCGSPDAVRRDKIAHGYSPEWLTGIMRSSWRITSHFPPDPALSGVWIDGRKLVLGDRLKVIYISDTRTATEVSVAIGDEAALIIDAKLMDSFKFIEKWITPRLVTTK